MASPNGQSANEAYLKQDLAPVVYIVIGVLGAVATIIVALRIAARYITNAKPGFDDFLAVVALLCNWALSGILIWSVKSGAGKNTQALTLAQDSEVAKTLYAIDIAYPTTLLFIKLSILFLYRRLFPNKQIRIGLWILVGLSTAWWLAFIFPSIFGCSPISAVWKIPPHPGNSGHCIHVNEFLLAIGIVHVITDAFILALPMPTIWRLRLPAHKKFLILAVFAVGAFDIAISCVRVNSIVDRPADKKTDSFRYITLTNIWMAVETHVAIIDACLPTILPFFRFVLWHLRLVERRQDRCAYYRGAQGTGPMTIEEQSDGTMRRVRRSRDSRRSGRGARALNLMRTSEIRLNESDSEGWFVPREERKAFGGVVDEISAEKKESTSTESTETV